MPQIRVTNTSGSIPTVNQLSLGDIGINFYDGKAYIKKLQGSVQTIVEIGGGSSISASYALSSSYASNGGVTQLIAGSNITLSPADGKGIVTINASTGGGGSGVPNGPNYSLQYNNGGNFSGSGNFTLLNNNALYLTGSFNVSGSTIQRGNNTLVGTTTLTGSILINGDIIPEVSSSFDLGSITNPWRSIYIQSGSISIQSDTPGGPPAVISNANGNVSIVAAGLQLKSGSFIPFEVSTTARTIIRVPDLPANDVGGLSIIGSSDGSYQPITNAGGLLHLTSNDGASSRITSDAFGTTAVAAYVGRKARGTAATPLPVQAGDTLTRISTVGWTGPEYGFTMSASAVLAATAIETIALDNFTTSSFGTRFQFYNAPSGSTIRTLSSTVDTTGITIPSSSRFFGTASWAISASQAISSSYTLSSSYALNGGVTQLLAGPNVTLSPTNGKGQVTVSATLSGSTIFNTSTGSYGSFYDTTTQTNPVGNVPRSMSLNTTDITNGVGISGSTSPFDTYIKTTNAGVYNIQFSAQLDKTDSGTDEIIIWLRKNGSDLTDTATTVTLVGNNAKNVSAWNWFVNSAANDYYQIIWQSADTNVRLFASGPAGGHPGIPSVIVTVNRVDQFLSNTGSFSGSFVGSFTGSLLGTASFAISASRAISSSYSLSSSYATNANYAASTPIVPSTLFTQGYLTGNQSIPNNTDTIINFERQYDPNSWLNEGTRRFTPTTAGYYLVTLGAWLENPASATNQVNVQIRKSVGGGPTGTVMILQQPLNNGTGISLSGTRILYMDGALDYLDFTIFQGSGAPRNLLYGGTPDGAGTWFSAHLITM
jgi:hypothetical protein